MNIEERVNQLLGLSLKENRGWTVTTKAKSSIGVTTVFSRRREKENGDYAGPAKKYSSTVWVTTDSEEDWYDISNAGGTQQDISDYDLQKQREKYPESKGWSVYDSESYAVNPPRKSRSSSTKKRRSRRSL